MKISKFNQLSNEEKMDTILGSIGNNADFTIESEDEILIDDTKGDSFSLCLGISDQFRENIESIMQSLNEERNNMRLMIIGSFLSKGIKNAEKIDKEEYQKESDKVFKENNFNYLSKTKTEEVQKLLNALKPATAAEYFYLGYAYQAIN